MSSKIVGGLVGDWDGKNSDFKKKSEYKKKLSELILKRRNLVFLPCLQCFIQTFRCAIYSMQIRGILKCTKTITTTYLL